MKVGAFNADIHFFSLLNRVARGEEVLIAKRGLHVGRTGDDRKHDRGIAGSPFRSEAGLNQRPIRTTRVSPVWQ